MCTQFIEAHHDNVFGIRWCEGCRESSIGFAMYCSQTRRIVWAMHGEHGAAATMDAAMLSMERVHYRVALDRSNARESDAVAA